jgi:hypothetical protein
MRESRRPPLFKKEALRIQYPWGFFVFIYIKVISKRE